jgi:uncharacterized protein (DUF924 family)
MGIASSSRAFELDIEEIEMTLPTQDEILKFWFEECKPQQWFKKDEAFDSALRDRFGDVIESALAGALDDWMESREGCLALILVLDQFTRNVHRSTAKAFAGDAKALSISDLCRERGYIDHPDQGFRHFMLIPMMHSEDLEVQEASLPLFKEHTDARVSEYAIDHRNIIARFGRYPHRNNDLGRPSTAEEIAFLQEPGSRF